MASNKLTFHGGTGSVRHYPELPCFTQGGEPATTGGGANAGAYTVSETPPQGTYSYRASFAGDSIYDSSTSGCLQLVVAKTAQSITFGPLGVKMVGDPDFEVSATAESNLRTPRVAPFRSRARRPGSCCNSPA